MSVRWMAVQYLGDVLRLPVFNASDIDKPVGHSTLERDVNRIEVNAFSENPEERRMFVPEDENKKLRELIRKYGEYIEQDRCEGCVCKRSCNDGDVDECWQLTEIRELARELGIEVDE